MKLRELQRWLILNDVKDSWRVRVDSHELANRHTLADLSCIVAEKKNAQVQVQHTEAPIGAENDWVKFEGEVTKAIRHLTRPPVSLPIVTDSSRGFNVSESKPKNFDLPPRDKEIDKLKARVSELEATLASLLEDMALLKRPIEEEIESLNERERFIEQSENVLIRKTQELEVKRAEIEQLSEIKASAQPLEY